MILSEQRPDEHRASLWLCDMGHKGWDSFKSPAQAAATKSTAEAPKCPDWAVTELSYLVLMLLLGCLGVVGLSVCLSQTERTPETFWCVFSTACPQAPSKCQYCARDAGEGLIFPLPGTALFPGDIASSQPTGHLLTRGPAPPQGEIGVFCSDHFLGSQPQLPTALITAPGVGEAERRWCLLIQQP